VSTSKASVCGVHIECVHIEWWCKAVQGGARRYKGALPQMRLHRHSHPCRTKRRLGAHQRRPTNAAPVGGVRAGGGQCVNERGGALSKRVSE
jgi:hypothetical protein